MKLRKILYAASFCLLIFSALTLDRLFPSSGSSAQVLQVTNPTGAQKTAAAPDWRQKVDGRVLSALAAGQTEFLIYLKQRADLSGARSLATKEEKGRYVYERLTAAAQATQPNVLRTLARVGARHQSFWSRTRFGPEAM